MRVSLLARCALVALVTLGLAERVVAQAQLEVPIRINFGGPEVVDADGNVWLGDLAGPGDVLGIRPDDNGGSSFVASWCAALDPFQVEADLGFAADDPVMDVFRSIRYDNGAVAPDFRLAFQVPNGDYRLRFYLCEECCVGRHQKLEAEGEILEADVHVGQYADGILGRVARLEYRRVAVSDGLLEIGILPCPECVGSIDNNAIINALEILPDSACDPEEATMDLACTYDGDRDRVVATWSPVVGAEAYRVLKNGSVFLPSLPDDATSFTDANPRNEGTDVSYTVQALDGDTPFEECTCRVSTFACARSLECELDEGSGDVSLSWLEPIGIDVTGYEIRANGVLVDTIGGNEVSYDHTPTERLVTYEVATLTDPAGQCAPMSCTLEISTVLLPTPFFLNAGGPQITDSLGRVWLGDQGAGLDPNNLRPDDAGGSNTIEAWCDPTQPGFADALAALGFDPSNPADADIFRSIRWDNGADGIDYVFELPVAEGLYDVQLLFCEQCCLNRHFRVEMQGETVFADVHAGAYAGGAQHTPGRLSAREIEVGPDNRLTIALLPCLDPECPGGTDGNAILSAIAVSEFVEDPCEDPSFRQCTSELTCELDPDGTVTATFTPPLCADVEGFQVLRNGAPLLDLPPDAIGFTDTLDERVGSYEVRTILAEGQAPCPALRCTVVDEASDFEVPLRINLGGNTTVDSRGRLWLGDPGANFDVLSIRPDDLGGTNAISNWCDGLIPTFPESFPDSFLSLGLDPLSPADRHIFDTIRWDVGDDDGDGLIGEDDDFDGGDVDYRLEIPVADGDYALNLYFTECCCPARHFRVEVEGEERAEDVHTGTNSRGGELGKTGVLAIEDVIVEDGALSVRLAPCPLCGGFADGNAILNALELLPIDSGAERCPWELACTLDLDGIATLQWNPPVGISVDSYRILRDGEEIDVIDGSETQYLDEPECQRITVYQVEPLGADPDALCPDLRLLCEVVNIECPFTVPVRINMGGRSMTDSNGVLWSGDPGAGLDPLDLRPDDLGGANAAEFWSAAVLDPASFEREGFDARHPGDRYIFSTIRWDTGNDGVDWRMALPMDDGDYTVTMFFAEACCPDRHFIIEIEGEVVEPDVSYVDYVPEGEEPGLGKLGRLVFEASVEDGNLDIALLPCPECPGVLDTNAILPALEITGESVEPTDAFVRGDSDSSGVVNLNDGIVTLNFLFLGLAEPPCLDAADTDDNGALLLNDAVGIFNWLFLGGPAPAEPSPSTGNYPAAECDTDPSADGLDCRVRAAKCGA